MASVGVNRLTKVNRLTLAPQDIPGDPLSFFTSFFIPNEVDAPWHSNIATVVRHCAFTAK